MIGLLAVPMRIKRDGIFCDKRWDPNSHKFLHFSGIYTQESCCWRKTRSSDRSSEANSNLNPDGFCLVVYYRVQNEHPTVYHLFFFHHFL